MTESSHVGAEALATNYWFGSRLSNAFTAGTVALERLYADRMPVTRMEVDCNVTESSEHGVDYFRNYLGAFRRVRDHLNRRRPRRVVNLGGGCAAAIALLPYLHSIHAGLRVIWIDAHFDLNVPPTSGSHYIHGMAVGVLTDPEWYSLFFDDPWCFDPRDFLFCGQKTCDPYEREFLDTHSLASVAPGPDFRSMAADSLADVKGSPVYLHLDLDVMHPELYSNPKCEIPKGIDFADLASIVATIQSTAELIGYSLAENPETELSKVRELTDVFPTLASR